MTPCCEAATGSVCAVDRVQRPALTRLHSAFRISWDFETARPNTWSNSITEEISNSCLIRSRSAPLGFSSGLRRKRIRFMSNRARESFSAYLISSSPERIAGRTAVKIASTSERSSRSALIHACLFAETSVARICRRAIQIETSGVMRMAARAVRIAARAIRVAETGSEAGAGIGVPR